MHIAKPGGTHDRMSGPRRGLRLLRTIALLALALAMTFVVAVWVRWSVLTGAVPATVALARLFRHGPTTVDDFRLYPARHLSRSDAPRPFRDRRGTLRSDATIDPDGSGPLPWRDFASGPDTLAMLVIHDDAIVFEHYAAGFTPDSPSQYFSVSKSVTSVLVGMAIDDAILASADAPITAQLPELDARGFGKVTPALLLTMSSGLDYTENDNPFGKHIALNYTPDIERMALRFRLAAVPATVHEYKSGDSALLALLLARALAPESITAYAQRRLWSPLGMEDDAVWSVDREGGLEKAWCCLAGSARDLAKFGRLMLAGGLVEGRPQLSTQWVARSIAADVLAPGLWPAAYEEVGFRGYGYGWWLAAAEDGDYFAQGKDGQFLYVNPSHDVIVVRLGRSESGARSSRWVGLFRQLARDAAKADPLAKRTGSG